MALVTVGVFDLVSHEGGAFDWGPLGTLLRSNVTRYTTVFLVVWLALMAAGTLLIMRLAGWTAWRSWGRTARVLLFAGALTLGWVALYWGSDPPMWVDATGRGCTLMHMPPDCEYVKRVPSLEVVGRMAGMSLGAVVGLVAVFEAVKAVRRWQER
jgi:hypothetical protein